MIEDENWDQARRQISKASAIIRRAASTLNMDSEDVEDDKDSSS